MRIYPLRLSKNYWKIPIYSIHKCNEYCTFSLFLDENNPNSLSINNNPDYNISLNQCPKFSQIEKDIIPIWKFDINSPQTQHGLLFNMDKIVIPDKNFKMFLTYPLTQPVDVEVISSTKNFTLRELIYGIKKAYIEIYNEEEETATPRNHIRKRICPCKYIDLKKTLKKNRNPINNKCSICHDKLNHNQIKLNCNHIFDKDCIEQWIDNDGTNCPLCREELYKCDICKGQKYLYNFYRGIVIPHNQRGYVMNRNHTDGIYGIYGHDLEDLCIENMYYNRVRKRLYIDIIS